MADRFVDFSAANDGDGTAFGQAGSPGGAGAYNTLVGKTWTTGDMVWIRRVTKTVTSTSAVNAGVATISQNGIFFIGWPISTDEYYSVRPAAAQGTWDADGGTYASMTTNTTTAASPLVNISGTDIVFHRFKFYNAYNSSSANQCLLVNGNNFVAKYCWMLNDSTYAGGSNHGMCVHMASTGGRFLNCIITHQPASAGNSAIIFCSSSGQDVEFSDCTILSTAVVTNSNLVQLGFASPCDVYFINTSITVTNTGYTTGITLSVSNIAAFFYANNLSISDSSNQSNHTNVDFGGTLSSALCVKLQNCDFYGMRRITLPLGAQAHFKRFYQTVPSSDYAINCGSYVIVGGNNFTFAPGNTTGDVQVTKGSSYYLQNAVFQSLSPFGAAPTQFHGVWCADYNNSVGNFQYTGPKGTMQSSSVYRSTGESFSIVLAMDSGAAPFWRGMPFIQPCFETIWASLSSGSNTITIYGAHKNWSSPPTQNDLWFDIDYLDQGSGARRAFATTHTALETALASDASTWNNDTGLTVFKLELVVTAGQACLAPIRIGLSRRNGTGIVYLDPKPVVS